jgi:hypothetical protein
MSTILKQRVVVENRPGGAQKIGIQSLLRAPRDGYTFAAASGASLAINPLIDSAIGYDPLKDFTFLSFAIELPTVLVVNPSVPARSLGELIAYAKANPGKTAAIIGVLTTLAAVAGGPVGGAIAGQILKGAAELLKGEKLSTAVGKGVKAAAFGWLTGKAVDFIGSALTDPMMAQAKDMGNDIVTANYNRTIDEIGGEFGNRFGTFSSGELFGRAADVKDVTDVYGAGVDAWKAGDYLRADSMFKSAADMTASLSKPEYIDAIAATVDKAQMMQASAEEMQKFFGTMSKVAQGAATAATGIGVGGQRSGVARRRIDAVTVCLARNAKQSKLIC